MNIIEYTDMTRPRSRSGTMVWISVFDDAICSIIAKPTGTSNDIERRKCREKVNAMSASPKPIAANATQRPSPFTSRFPASVSAPSSAPAPAAPIRSPSPRAPLWRMSSAKIGMSTAYGISTRLARPSMRSRARMGGVRTTKRNPSMICEIAEGLCFGRWKGSSLMRRSPAI
jgi:hypothetical protein